MPKVSVIIPAYNAGRYICDAIDSALAQTFTDIEIIVVDDGSTDNTGGLVAQYADPRIRYLYQDNRGLSGARNTGILHAGGDLIGLLDADDVWKPEFLQVLCDLLDQHPHAAGAYSGYQYMDACRRLLPQTFTRTEAPERYAAALLGGNWITPSAVVLRKSIFSETGLFDQSVSLLEDYEMWLRLAQTSHLVGIAQILCYYRLSTTQLSSDSIRMAHGLHELTIKHFGIDDCVPAAWSQDKRRTYCNLYGFSANAFLGAGDVEAGARHLVSLATLDGQVVNNVSLWYTFACSYQQKGELGDVRRLDMAKSEHLMQSLIEAASAPSQPHGLTYQQRRQATATARLALAQIYYGRREVQRSMKRLLEAFLLNPLGMVRRRLFWSLLWRVPAYAVVRALRTGRVRQ